MMRTCGIADDELKGRGAHNLGKLLQNVIPLESKWPATREDILHLSDAYLKARYPTGQPTDHQYDEKDGVRAKATAKQVVSWVLSQDLL